MSQCATASDLIRCAPSFRNISPTTDLPLAMPPVRPSFSKGFSRCVRIGIVLVVGPQEIDQSNYSDNQRAYVAQPAGSPWENDWPKENQNIHQACGNSPASRRGLSLQNGPPSRSSDGGHHSLEQHEDEQIPESQESVVLTNYVCAPKKEHDVEHGLACENPAQDLSDIYILHTLMPPLPETGQAPSLQRSPAPQLCGLYGVGHWHGYG